jgi:hypothetical protein
MAKTIAAVLLGGLVLWASAVSLHAAKPGPSAGILGLEWGDGPSAHMRKVERTQGLDLYESLEPNRMIAGRHASIVRFGFYKNRLCEINVVWQQQPDAVDFQQIASALADSWGSADKVEVRNSKHTWNSPDGGINAGLWRETNITGGPAVLLVVMHLPCVSQAASDAAHSERVAAEG